MLTPGALSGTTQVIDSFSCPAATVSHVACLAELKNLFGAHIEAAPAHDRVGEGVDKLKPAVVIDGAGAPSGLAGD
jgi:hypothetical protein